MTQFHNVDKQKQKCDPTNEQRSDKCFSKVLANELGCNLPWFPNAIGTAKISTYRKLAFSTRSRFVPALAYNPQF